MNIIENEKECVKRQNGCFCDNKRDCKNCDLVLPEESIVKAYDITIEVIKRQIPKKANKLKTRSGIIDDYSVGYCPSCGKGVNDIYDYCPKCGQHLDWMEKNEFNYVSK